MFFGSAYYCCSRLRNRTLAARSALVWSKEARIEARDPETREKMKTPDIMRQMQKSCSVDVPMGISPYPTVVMVVITK